MNKSFSIPPSFSGILLIAKMLTSFGFRKNVYVIYNHYDDPGISGLQLIRDITSGKLFGDEIGSMAVTLHPSSIGCGTFTADTKTAG